MIKLFIFDFDGLMVNSEYVIFEALKDLFKRYNRRLTWQYFCRHIGIPVADALKNFHNDYTLPVSLDKFIQARNEIVSQYIDKKLSLMPGLLSLLKLLQSDSITMAIASSGKKDYIKAALEKFKINLYFQNIICIDDVKFGKPKPDLILKTLEVTGYKKSESIIIEDSPNGIEAADQAGIYSIAIPTKGVSYEYFRKASIIVKDLIFLRKILMILGK